jgi:integrase
MPLTLYRRKGSRIYHYRGTIGPTGRRKFFQGSTRTEDKDIAARQIAEIETKYWRGHFDGPEAILTFDQAAANYLAAGKSGRFLGPVRKYLATTLIKEIAPGTIIQMAMELFGHCSGASRNRLAIIPAQAVINFNAKSKLCQRIQVERFKTETKEKPHATLEWIKAFQQEATQQESTLPLGAHALFMFLTGARPTEALEADIDLPSATALLHESKIGHERRAHLPPMLVAALANIPKIKGRGPFIYRRTNDLEYAWDGVVKRAGLQRLTPHCCRHGCITMLLRNRVDVKTVSWLCDITPETLLKTYAHAIKDRTLTEVLTNEKTVQPVMDVAGNMLKTGTS